MQKVLIVDDEPIARNSIQFIIEKHIPELEIVGMSSSGKDAIAKNYEYRPDIIIMDINMPGINGIDAMRQIRMTNSEVEFIIISAYDYFDYASEAITLNAAEYILKPVKKEKLIEVLKRVMLKIEQRQLDMMRQLEQNERMKMIMPILENGFINSLCLYDSKIEELKEYCQLFEYQVVNGFVLVIEFLEMSNVEDKIKGSNMLSTYRDILKGICDCVVGPIMSNRVVVYVNKYCVNDENERKKRSVEIAEKVVRRTQHIFKDVCIGVGNYYDELSLLKQSYREATKALRYIDRKGLSEEASSRVYHISDNADRVELDNDTYENLFETYVFDCMKTDNIDKARAGFEEIFDKMVKDINMDYLAIKNAIIGFIVGLSKRWYSYTGDYYSVMSAILDSNDEEDLYSCAYSYLNDMILKITNDVQNKEKNIVKLAQDFIEQHYSEDISLEDIAREVNLSPNYFSRIFKECTGINFSDRLLSYRMEKAKQILKNTDHNVKDISYMVGYVDPNYFTKLFKKYTGITASDYRKMVKARQVLSM